MTIFNRQKFFNKFDKLDEYTNNLKELALEVKEDKNKFIDDFHFFGLAERYLQLVIQIVIDTTSMIIVEEKWKRPLDNQDAISLLYNNKVISKNLASRLDGIVGFRNILVHEYEVIDKNKVYNYLQERIVDLEDFKKEILNYLK
jgi:uncharacterized protein YutE (UPF0331/DUF86 family)